MRKFSNNQENITKNIRCALKAITSSTALIIFSLIHFGMTKVATRITIGAEMNLLIRKMN